MANGRPLDILAFTGSAEDPQNIIASQRGLERGLADPRISGGLGRAIGKRGVTEAAEVIARPDPIRAADIAGQSAAQRTRQRLAEAAASRLGASRRAGAPAQQLTSAMSDAELARATGIPQGARTRLERKRSELQSREAAQTAKDERLAFVKGAREAEIEKAVAPVRTRVAGAVEEARIRAGSQEAIAEEKAAADIQIQSIKEDGLNARQKAQLSQKDGELKATLEQEQEQFEAGGGRVGSPEQLQLVAQSLTEKLAEAQARNDGLMQRAVVGEMVKVFQSLLPTQGEVSQEQAETAAQTAQALVGVQPAQAEAQDETLADEDGDGVPDQNEQEFNFISETLEGGVHPKTGQPLTPAQIERAKKRLSTLRGQL